MKALKILNLILTFLAVTLNSGTAFAGDRPSTLNKAQTQAEVELLEAQVEFRRQLKNYLHQEDSTILLEPEESDADQVLIVHAE